MQDCGWERFTQTGHVCDYLSYKCQYTNTTKNSVKNFSHADLSDKQINKSLDSVEDCWENKYAGFCNINRNSN